MPGALGEAAAKARYAQTVEEKNRANTVWLEMCAAQDAAEARLTKAKEGYDELVAQAIQAELDQPPPPAAVTSGGMGATPADSEDDGGSSGDSTRPAPPPERVSERQAKRKAETQQAAVKDRPRREPKSNRFGDDYV